MRIRQSLNTRLSKVENRVLSGRFAMVEPSTVKGEVLFNGKPMSRRKAQRRARSDKWHCLWIGKIR